MRNSLCTLLVIGSVTANFATADDAKEAVNKDRQRIEGTWQVTALTINGNKAKAEDVKKLTVVNGSDGTWSVRSEGREISSGTSTVDPTKKPKTIDFTPTSGGGKGEKFLGIYKLGKNSRRLCFSPSGKARPTEFSSTTDNQHVLVVFKRIEKASPLGVRDASSTEELVEDTDGRVLFADNFDSGKLPSDWSWLREDRQSWRLREAALEIRVEPGKANTVKNALLRDVPDRSRTSYAVEVTVTNLTVPTQQFEQAGIVWYCDGKPVFKLVKELVDGQLMIIPGRQPMEDASVRLRLIVTADSWTAQYQPSAKGPLQVAASGKLPPALKDQVSVQCYNGPPAAEHWIRFDDFRIVEVDTDASTSASGNP